MPSQLNTATIRVMIQIVYREHKGSLIPNYTTADREVDDVHLLNALVGQKEDMLPEP